jgi:hypothetical protein
MESTSRRTSAEARTLLTNLVGNGSKNEYIGADNEKDLTQRSIEQFVLLIKEGHGPEASDAASVRLKEHLDKGVPLSYYEAKQVLTECIIPRPTESHWKTRR